MDFKLYTVSKFPIFSTPYAPTLSTPKHQPQMWETCSLSKILELLDHLCYLSDILNDHCHFSGGVIFSQQHIKFSNGPTSSTLRDNLCIYVVISYSLLKPAFHVQISHILLQNDLKHQFFFGYRCLLPLTGLCPLPL